MLNQHNAVTSLHTVYATLVCDAGTAWKSLSLLFDRQNTLHQQMIVL